MKRKLFLLFAVLVGGTLAFIVNRTESKAEVLAKRTPVFVKVGFCLHTDGVCFTEKIGKKTRIYPGTWVEISH